MKRRWVVVLWVILAGILVSCGEKSVSPSATEGLSLYKNNDYVVFEDLRCTSGQQLWQDFYNKVRRGETDTVKLVYYYTLQKNNVSKELYEKEKTNYPQMFIGELSYDGSKYKITVRQSTKKEPDKVSEYKYLKRYTGKPTSSSSTFSSYEYYVLVNDVSVTWEQIEYGMFSSKWGDRIDHYSVYTNLIY